MSDTETPAPDVPETPEVPSVPAEVDRVALVSMRADGTPDQTDGYVVIE